MSFNESIIYVVLFVVIINIFDFLKVRWKAGKLDSREKYMWEFKNRWLVTIVLFVFIFMYSFYSCYYAYKGFLAEYTKSMSLVGTLPFLIGGVVLVRKSILTIIELHKKNIMLQPKTKEKGV